MFVAFALPHALVALSKTLHLLADLSGATHVVAVSTLHTEDWSAT